MDPRFQRRVQRYGWDRAVVDYDRFWREQLAPAQELLLRMAELRPGQRVLDVACGTGLVSLPAAAAVGSEGSVVGTDISDGMVDKARSAAESEGLANASFERMEAENLAFPDASFDVVLCSLGLMYVPDPLAGLREAHRVLKAGGVAVNSVWGARGNCGWAEIFPIVDRRVESEVCPLFFQLGTGASLAAVYENAGFGDVVTERISILLHYDRFEDACGAAFAGGPVAMAYSRFDEATREEAHAEYRESIERFRNGGRYRIPGEFVVVRGRKGA
jgi:ubiquinone/menaquinone biosynthesis C-methylase UbiE